MGDVEAVIINVQHSVATPIMNELFERRPHSLVYHLSGIARLQPSKLELAFPHVASVCGLLDLPMKIRPVQEFVAAFRLDDLLVFGFVKNTATVRKPFHVHYIISLFYRTCK